MLIIINHHHHSSSFLTHAQNEFWSDVAHGFHWETEWDAARTHSANLHKSKGKVEIEWFAGGKTNICYNSLDRHVLAGHGDNIAFYWEGNDPAHSSVITYSGLLERVKLFTSALRRLGTFICSYRHCTDR